ncbi:hypothetical protein AVEN_46939-1 [Araneus ventricosus]|uniref:Uncharacterized protein n=1 Tax=Araneus ventricosus TaxID=182803 RepID=A0A4Y2FKX4_ARAVE|nr:hypothetical protein AVEN_46939-1 [Araneus ventricosus]
MEPAGPEAETIPQVWDLCLPPDGAGTLNEDRIRREARSDGKRQALADQKNGVSPVHCSDILGNIDAVEISLECPPGLNFVTIFWSILTIIVLNLLTLY